MPITPMLDMTFQLLSFFLLTFTPHSATEGKLDFSLPGALGTRPEDPTPVCILLADEEREKLTLLVRAGGEGRGNITALIVETAEGQQTLRDLKHLRQYLRDRRAEPARTEVRIAAD